MNEMPSFADPANLERTGNRESVELSPDATSLTLLQAVYRSPDLPLATRLRAATAALPHEHPKLGVNVSIPMSEEFAVRLEHAIRRTNGVHDPRLIEHQPSEPQPSRITEPSAPIGPVPDRRFRRA